MSRLVYVTFSLGGVQGGHKMAYRHVETLRDLGFDAVIATSPHHTIPTWFDHRAPVEQTITATRRDTVVVPDDADDILQQAADAKLPTVIFAQSNPTQVAASLTAAVDRFGADCRPRLMVVAPMLADLYGRLMPDLEIEVVPCFADERLFRPQGARRRAVAFAPRKRPHGATAILTIHRRLYRTRPELPEVELSGATEVEVARAFASSTLHLSLSRLESVGMTALEAMASGCVCAGFTGVGGRAYATADNGFWAPEDDVEAAAAALAEADELACAGGPALERVIDAGAETARNWSYARFRTALEETWMRLAPDARVQSGPLEG